MIRMNFREIERKIKADGWTLDRIDGSHHQYEHPTKTGLVTIPKHSGDIPKKTLHSILKQAGLKK
jgi:predicted RNA binding protein YcfA (HicA-like mRNA interferase family)